MQIRFLSWCHSVILMSPGEMWKEADAGTFHQTSEDRGTQALHEQSDLSLGDHCFGNSSGSGAPSAGEDDLGSGSLRASQGV